MNQPSRGFSLVVHGTMADLRALALGIAGGEDQDSSANDVTHLSDANARKVADLEQRLADMTKQRDRQSSLAQEMGEAAAQAQHTLAFARTESDALHSHIRFACLDVPSGSLVIARWREHAEALQAELRAVMEDHQMMGQAYEQCEVELAEAKAEIERLKVSNKRLASAQRKDIAAFRAAEAHKKLKDAVAAQQVPRTHAAPLPEPKPASVRQEASPAPTAQVVPLAPPPAEPEEPSDGCIARVNVVTLQIRGPKGTATLRSSPIARALAHMQDGQLYGQDTIVKVGKFMDTTTLLSTFQTHRKVLEDAGLTFWSDKFNIRLKVIE